jgi:undecaprenyl-diphosphatase
VIVVGLVLHKIWGASLFDSALIVGWSTLVFGLVLGVCDGVGARRERALETEMTAKTMTLKYAFIIGLAQCFALIPGTSRSGITMSAARYFGFSREESARFALWLGMVAISGASTLAGLDLITSQSASAFQKDFMIAALLSALMAFIAIALMMRFIGKLGFMPFVVYRLILGSVILGLCYAGILV